MKSSPLHRLFRRDARDLDSAIRLAKGGEITEMEMTRLKRAGVARKNRKSPLAPSVVAALLSISESMERGRGVLRSLKDRLRNARSRQERDVIIISIKEELTALEGRASDLDLIPLLEEISSILDRLDPEQADPAETMAAAKTVAGMIERIAGRVAPVRQETKRKLPEFGFDQLKNAIDDVPFLSRPVIYPDVHELAAALRGEDPPPVRVKSSRSYETLPDRRDEAITGLADQDPVAALFTDDVVVAMERHAALASIGRKGLDDHGRYPSLTLRRLDEFDVGELIAV